MKQHMERWYNLANAIIVQAAKDYRSVLNKLWRYKNTAPNEQQKYELERFCCSDWFGTLSTADVGSNS